MRAKGRDNGAHGKQASVWGPNGEKWECVEFAVKLPLWPTWLPETGGNPQIDGGRVWRRWVGSEETWSGEWDVGWGRWKMKGAGTSHRRAGKDDERMPRADGSVKIGTEKVEQRAKDQWDERGEAGLKWESNREHED